MISPEELRRAAFSSAQMEDRAVAEALRTGDIWIRHAVATWESSEGTTSGHLVGIGLDAALFAHIAPEPPVVDALTVAIAESIALQPLESLHELRIHWNGAVREKGHYRGDSLRSGMPEALETYLTERGEVEAARRARHVKLDIASRGRDITATMDVSSVTRTAGESLERDLRAISEALCLLLVGPEGAHVRVIRSRPHF
ncbi:hypothetical protein LVJ94_43975 [Pendulispora rubella]|uniref:Uncharacterized protein n=1 Tax=Pendulispora rubella TaxID=2741070 RepID=A0ABZ2L1K1_9BACT